MSARFAAGERVRIKALFPPGHVRTPWFLRGRPGAVVEVLGAFGDPERLAYSQPAPRVPLYRVRFRQADLWPGEQAGTEDTLVADIFEHWLEPMREAQG
jgi:nitrile hydratase